MLIVVNDVFWGCWPEAVVEEKFCDHDGLLRRVRLCTAKGAHVRDIRKICLLQATE